MQKLILLLTLAVAFTATLAAAEPVRLRVDFSRPDGEWNMPALALGQGGLQGGPAGSGRAGQQYPGHSLWPVGRPQERDAETEALGHLLD